MNFEDLITLIRKRLTNQDGARYPQVFPAFENLIGKTLSEGYRLQYQGELWKVRQEHTVQDIYPPSIETASIYERIDLVHEGTESDPIPYDPNLAVTEGEIYKQNDVLYRCIRDSGNPLYADCASLIGVYFELLN